MIRHANCGGDFRGSGFAPAISSLPRRKGLSEGSASNTIRRNGSNWTTDARGWQHRGNEDGCLGNGAPKENLGCLRQPGFVILLLSTLYQKPGSTKSNHCAIANDVPDVPEREMRMITQYPQDISQWQEWQKEYQFGVILIFPPEPLLTQVNLLRARYDPRSQAACDAHISLTVPLPQPISDSQWRELEAIVSGIEPFPIQYGPLRDRKSTRLNSS